MEWLQTHWSPCLSAIKLPLLLYSNINRDTSVNASPQTQLAGAWHGREETRWCVVGPGWLALLQHPPWPREQSLCSRPWGQARGRVNCHPGMGAQGCPWMKDGHSQNTITLGSSPFWGSVCITAGVQDSFPSHQRSCQDPWGMCHQPQTPLL